MIQAGCVKQPLKDCETLIVLWLQLQRSSRSPALPWHHPQDPCWELLLLPPPVAQPMEAGGASVVEIRRERAAAVLAPYMLQVTALTHSWEWASPLCL